MGLNAPTGAGCSLTRSVRLRWRRTLSQCTYRCGVLPDAVMATVIIVKVKVSMHLQVRGAP